MTTNKMLVLAAVVGAGISIACFSERVAGPDDSTVCTSSASARCLVRMLDNSFSPATLRVTAGSTVSWENDGASPHTSTSDSWDSGTVTPGLGFERPFPTPGSFDYECIFHSGMNGRIVVE